MKEENKKTTKPRRKRKTSSKKKQIKVPKWANNIVSFSIVLVLSFVVLLWFLFFGRYVDGHTLKEVPLWLCFIPAVIGVVVFLKKHTANLGIKSFLKGLGGSAFGGIMVAFVLYTVFLIINYVFSFHHPIYERKARITDLNFQVHSRGGNDWLVYFEFLDNGEKAKVNDKDFFHRVFIGDTATLSLKDGLFYIPIVKDLEYEYKK